MTIPKDLNTKLIRRLILLVGLLSIASLIAGGRIASNDCSAGIPVAHGDVGRYPSINQQQQQIAEKALNTSMQKSKSHIGLVLVQHIETGQITAIAAQEGVSNKKCYSGWAEAFKAWEPGSSIKPLVAASALNENRMSLDDTFYNSGQLTFGDTKIVNAMNINKRDYSYREMINYSINIGAVSALKKLSNNNKIDDQAKNTWHQYLTSKFMFGKPTGAFSGEHPGYVPKPNGQYSTEARYAYTSFGIGLTTTPVQLASAYSSLVNDGMYISPKLEVTSPNTPSHRAISSVISNKVVDMLATATKLNVPQATHSGYIVGGKSGTGPAAGESGNYQYYKSNGVYVGFVGKTKPTYIVLAKLDQPETGTKLASAIASMLWTDVVQQMMQSGQLKL